MTFGPVGKMLNRKPDTHKAGTILGVHNLQYSHSPIPGLPHYQAPTFPSLHRPQRFHSRLLHSLHGLYIL